jgi:hypothetical protein
MNETAKYSKYQPSYLFVVDLGYCKKAVSDEDVI